MQVQVNTNKLVAKSRDYINENEYNIHEVNFDFAEEYTDNLVKVALFSNAENTYKVIIANNKCDIPTEILQKKSTFVLGVYAYETQNDELILRYSPSPITLFVSAGSYIPDEETENSEPITPSELEQYQQALQDGLSEVSGTITSMTNLIDEVQTKLDNGEFNGADGRDGEDGFSPIITETQTSTGYNISITDKTGTNTISLVNGKDGEDGSDGLPGATGNGISSINKTSTSGLIDTYTINYTNGNTTTYTVTNGAKWRCRNKWS